MGILRPAPASPATAATTLWRTPRCGRRRPNNRGPKRPVCTVRRLPGILRHVLCGDDATAGGAGRCRGCGAGNLILCLVFYAAIFFGPCGREVFVDLFSFCWSCVPLCCVPFVVFCFFAVISCFCCEWVCVGERERKKERGRERAHIWERARSGKASGMAREQGNRKRLQELVEFFSLPSLSLSTPDRMGWRRETA